MSNDYANGFKDGFKAGLEEGKKLNQKSYDPWVAPWPTTSPNISLHETCPKCGIKIGGAMGYVCHSPNCPTFPQVTCGPGMAMTAGAVGSVSDNMGSWSTGANGPADQGYNSVWINGKWAELGN